MPIKKALDGAPFRFLTLTVLYGFVYTINNLLTPFLHLVPAAHLVHIPSGIKFLMVLIFWFTGALSIAVVGFDAKAFPGHFGVRRPHQTAHLDKIQLELSP